MRECEENCLHCALVETLSSVLETTPTDSTSQVEIIHSVLMVAGQLIGISFPEKEERRSILLELQLSLIAYSHAYAEVELSKKASH